MSGLAKPVKFNAKCLTDWFRLLSAPLPSSFYQRNTVQVAQDLLGKILIVRARPSLPLGHPEDRIAVGRIVETEAYRGDDPASHSCRGITPRCSVMFEAGGVAYVYFIYGMYEMLNFVTEPEGFPGAVLIRAIEPLFGINQATNGPGKLCRALGIQMSHNRQRLCGPSFYVVDDGFVPGAVSSSGRIGIRVGIEKPWRFFLSDNAYVSKGRPKG